jgi:site-specific DNA recombinase
VQARLKEQAVERSAVRSSTPALLPGRIFDDRMNPMTPTHANKQGVRYRYYVSQALLQGRVSEAGSIARVSAPDVEALVANALRANSDAGRGASDREFIENHLGRAVVGRDEITIALRSGDSAQTANQPNDAPTISVPFRANLPPRKALAHAPSGGQAIVEATRTSLLVAIARSKVWVDAMVKDAATDIGTIAKQEGLAERHIRFLLPLAYLSPRIIEEIVEGRAPAVLIVTRLVGNLPTVWADQEKQLGLA